MLYKTLGFAVWKAAKWYLGRKVKPGRRFVGVGLGVGVAVAVATGLAVGAKRNGGS
jgi:hypothetical protein